MVKLVDKETLLKEREEKKRVREDIITHRVHVWSSLGAKIDRR